MLKIKNDKHKQLEIDYEKTNKYSVKFEKLSDGKKISLMNDNMFKTMFVNSKNVKYGAKLISYFVESSYEELLSSIRILNNEVDKDNIYSKNQRCDYVAQINDAIVNIEVNCNSTIDALLKSLTYGYRWFTKDIKVGSGYTFTQTIQINLNNFSFKGIGEVIEIFYLQNDKQDVITDKLIFINVSIPNLREKWYNKGINELDELERYVLSLIETDVLKAREIGMDDEFMQNSIDEQVKFCMTDDLREAYDHDLAWKEECRRQGLEEGREQGLSEGRAEGKAQGLEEGRAEGREEGRAEGREEGRVEGREEIIKNMSRNGMSKQEISKMTNIPIREIEKILK